MFIHEAVKEAVITDGYIRRKQWPEWIFQPTNTSDCVVCVLRDKRLKCWNPQADDLVADDWEVIDPENGLRENEFLAHKDKNEIRGITIEIPTTD